MRGCPKTPAHAGVFCILKYPPLVPEGGIHQPKRSEGGRSLRSTIRSSCSNADISPIIRRFSCNRLCRLLRLSLLLASTTTKTKLIVTQKIHAFIGCIPVCRLAKNVRVFHTTLFLYKNQPQYKNTHHIAVVREVGGAYLVRMGSRRDFKGMQKRKSVSFCYVGFAAMIACSSSQPPVTDVFVPSH